MQMIDRVNHPYDMTFADGVDTSTVDRTMYFIEDTMSEQANKLDSFGTVGTAGTFMGCFGTFGTVACCC